MKNKTKIIFIISFLVVLGVSAWGFYLNKDIKYLNKVSEADVKFYYLHEDFEETKKTQTLMALTTDGTAKPIFSIKEGSTAINMIKNEEYIYIYDELTHFFSDEDVKTPRMLIRYSIKDHKVEKYTSDTGFSEGNYFLSERSKEIEEIKTFPQKKVRNVIELDNAIITLTDNNTLSKVIDDQISSDRNLSEYEHISYIKKYNDKLFVVGMDNKDNILLSIIDENLKLLNSKSLPGIKDAGDIITSNGIMMGIVYRGTDSNQKSLITIDENLNHMIIDEDFSGENLFYSGEDSKYYYYDLNESTYVSLDSNGEHQEILEVTPYDDRYDFPFGKLYIN